MNLSFPRGIRLPESKLASASQANQPRLHWFLRTIAALFVIGLVTLLVLARSLQPNRSGVGTHQQLGLPPCSIVELWGVRCPSCGMTTSWAHLLRGEFRAAASANLAGAMLAVIALAYLPFGCYFSIAGRRSAGGWFSTAAASVLVIACCIAVAEWGFRIWL